jgi:hypothetical protein
MGSSSFKIIETDLSVSPFDAGSSESPQHACKYYTIFCGALQARFDRRVTVLKRAFWEKVTIPDTGSESRTWAVGRSISLFNKILSCIMADCCVK